MEHTTSNADQVPSPSILSWIRLPGLSTGILILDARAMGPISNGVPPVLARSQGFLYDDVKPRSSWEEQTAAKTDKRLWSKRSNS